MLLTPCLQPSRYHTYGMTLSSDILLPELASTTHTIADAAPDIRFSLADDRGMLPTPLAWFLSRRSASGTLWLSCARTNHGYLLRFPDLADFSVDAGGREIVGAAGPDTTGDTLRHLLLDQVLPLVVTLQGRYAFHATAVLTPTGVCAFTGPAGTGKSTLAASFLFAGFPLLSDDCLIVEPEEGRMLARPAYPGLRLWEDSLAALCPDQNQVQSVAQYTSKRRPVLGARLAHFPRERHPLARIYSLCRREGMDEATVANAWVEPLAQQASLLELLACTFILDTEDRATWLGQFRWLGQIVAAVPVRRLHIPSRFAALSSVRETVLADLGSP